MSLTAHWTVVPSCCGISLRNGVLWIAEICTVVGLSLVLFSAFAIDEIIWHWHYRYGPFTAVMHGLALVLGLAQTSTSLLLALGVVRERATFFRPWLVFFTVQTLLLALAAVAVAVLTVIYVEPLPLGIVLVLVATAYCYAFRYFILVVYSYYRQITVTSPSPGSTSGVMQLA